MSAGDKVRWIDLVGRQEAEARLVPCLAAPEVADVQHDVAEPLDAGGTGLGPLEITQALAIAPTIEGRRAAHG